MSVFLSGSGGRALETAILELTSDLDNAIHERGNRDSNRAINEKATAVFKSFALMEQQGEYQLTPDSSLKIAASQLKTLLNQVLSTPYLKEWNTLPIEKLFLKISEFAVSQDPLFLEKAWDPRTFEEYRRPMEDLALDMEELEQGLAKAVRAQKKLPAFEASLRKQADELLSFVKQHLNVLENGMFEDVYQEAHALISVIDVAAKSGWLDASTISIVKDLKEELQKISSEQNPRDRVSELGLDRMGQTGCLTRKQKYRKDQFIKILKKFFIDLSISLVMVGVTALFISNPATIGFLFLLAIGSVAFNVLIRYLLSHPSFYLVPEFFKEIGPGLVFGNMAADSIGTLIHEGGHALAADALFQNADPHISITPFGDQNAGVTNANTNFLSSWGQRIGMKMALFIFSAGGPAIQLLVSTICLGLAGTKWIEKYPTLRTYLFSFGVIYAGGLTNYSLCAPIPGDDFVSMSQLSGINPAAFVAMTLLPYLVFLLVLGVNKLSSYLSENKKQKVKQEELEREYTQHLEKAAQEDIRLTAQQLRQFARRRLRLRANENLSKVVA